MPGIINFEGRKLSLEEVTCDTCGSTRCNSQSCYVDVINSPGKLPVPGVSYAQVLFSGRARRPSNFYQDDYLPSLVMTKRDEKLGSFQTIVGGFYDSEPYPLIDILRKDVLSDTSSEKVSNVNCQDYIDSLRTFTKERNQRSMVGNHKNNTVRVNTNTRVSWSVKFGKETVKQLSEFIKPKLIESFKYTYFEPEEIIIHPDHGDLILYETGGKFNIHRDKELKKPFNHKKGGVMYSLIICLDSNLEDREKSDEGNTAVFLPPYINTEVTLLDSERKGISCVPHVFNESVIQFEYLGFPSGARHSSIEIKTPNKFKFILKLDFWVIKQNKLKLPYDLFFNIKYYDNYLRKLERDETYQRLGNVEGSLSIPQIDMKCQSYWYMNYSVPKTKEKNFSSSSLGCNCKKCDPFRKRYQVSLYHYMIKKCPNINMDILKIINSFLPSINFMGLGLVIPVERNIKLANDCTYQEEEERIMYLDDDDDRWDCND